MANSPGILQSLALLRRRDSYRNALYRLTDWQKSPVVRSWARLPPAVRGRIKGAVGGLALTGLIHLEQRLNGDSRIRELAPLAIPFVFAWREGRAAALQQRASIDPLMGVLRREAFAEWVDRQQPALSGGHDRSILYTDVDNFKAWNDLFGQKAGDVLLRRIGRRALSIMRSTDIVARPRGEVVGRHGGDELLFGGAFSSEQGREIAARMEKFIRTVYDRRLLDLQSEINLNGTNRAVLQEKLSHLMRFPLGLSVVVHQLKPGESLESVFPKMDARLKEEKRQRRELRERAF